jgi:hypothetical protein
MCKTKDFRAEGGHLGDVTTPWPNSLGGRRAILCSFMRRLLSYIFEGIREGRWLHHQARLRWLRVVLSVVRNSYGASQGRLAIYARTRCAIRLYWSKSIVENVIGSQVPDIRCRRPSSRPIWIPELVSVGFGGQT